MIKIPPFMDSHIHFTVGGMPASREELERIMERCTHRGIFALKDMGHKSGIGLSAKQNAQPGLLIMTAGYALFKKGGYGTFLGRGVDGKEEIIRAVKEIADAGVDFLKVINSGIVSTTGSGMITTGGFLPEELKIIHEEAQKRNLEVVCHANSDSAIKKAVTAGVSSIEHGFFVSRETLHMMSELGTAWTPTAYALQALASAADPSGKNFIEKVVDGHLSSLQYAASIGVRLHAGTDSGSTGVRHGESFFEELRLWQGAGLRVEQILSAACMGRDQTDKGNFLIVRKDFIATGTIEAAFRNGIRTVP